MKARNSTARYSPRTNGESKHEKICKDMFIVIQSLSHVQLFGPCGLQHARFLCPSPSLLLTVMATSFLLRDSCPK